MLSVKDLVEDLELGQTRISTTLWYGFKPPRVTWSREPGYRKLTCTFLHRFPTRGTV